MFYPMAGKLQSKAEVKEDLNERYIKGNLNWITFKISKSTCQRVKKYLTTYKEENIQNIYGLVFNPRKKEGAGCSAFGMSLLQVAGLMTDEFKTEFAQRIYVNNNLNGYNGSVNSVSFFKILFGIRSKEWAKDVKSGKELFFWRPNLMYSWVSNKIRTIKSSNLFTYKVEKRGVATGLLIDKSMVATPNKPIFINKHD